jgi:PKD domain
MARGAALALMAALVIAAPASGAGWLAPAVIGQSAATDEDAPAIAMAPDGSAVVAWAAALPGGKYAVRVATRGPAAPFGAEQTLPEGGASVVPLSLRVAINVRGDAAVAWRAGAQASVAVRPAGATFGAPAAIPSTPYDADDLALGIDGNGTATVAVVESQFVNDESCDTIKSRIYRRYLAYPVSVTGTIGSSQPIFTGDADCVLQYGSMSAPAVAVNERGDAVASVQSTSGGGGVHVLSRALPGGGFGNQIGLVGAFRSAVALAPNGHFVVAATGPSVSSVTGVAGAAPAPSQTLSTSPPTASAAAAGIDASGIGTVTWQATPGADVYRAYARGVSAAGTPGPVLPELSPQITDSASPFLAPRIAVGGPGAAFVVWRAIDEPSGHYEIDAALRAPGGAFAPAGRISGDATQDATEGAVAADGAGGAIAVFRRFDGGSNRIYAAPYDAAAPVVASIDGPASATAGAPVSYAATVSDDWGPVTLHWDFGDGSTADEAAPAHAFAAAGAPTITVTATDAAGNQATATRPVAVAAAAQPVPTVTGVRLTPSRFRVAKAATAVTAKRARRGTRIRFTLAAQAAVKIAFQRRTAGRRSKGRCVKPTRRLRRAKRCKRYVGEGRLTRANVAAGPVSIRFSGRVGRRALRRGRHRVVVRAATASGAKATGKPARFSIVR